MHDAMGSYVFVFVQHYVLEFQVPVHAVVEMHIAHGADELCEYLLRFGYREPAVLDANLAREIHHHRQLVHPHITRLYEVIVTETLVWLVLEYCPGTHNSLVR